MRRLLLLLLILGFGCEPTLDDIDGTRCTGAIPTTIRLVDYENEHPLPCSVDEAERTGRVSNADTFRENPPSVLCLLEEADITCTEIVDPEVTFYRCETTHPAAPPGFRLLTLTTRGDHCP